MIRRLRGASLRALVGLSWCAVLQPGSANAYIDTKSLYEVLDTRDEPASLTWFHPYDGSAIPGSDAFLVIWVEGVDLGELDKVSFNGEDLGYLAQQTFYNEVYEVHAGPGTLGLDRTDLVPSFFTIAADKLKSLNTVKVELDGSGGGYMAEIETSELLVRSVAPRVVTDVPEPGTWLQLVAGVGALSLWRRARRRDRG